MADTAQSQDPLEYLKSMWGGMGFSLPGMVTPTLDVDELDKHITDLKTVEGWLKMNLNMLQMSIQGLEMQRATLAAFQAISQSAGSGEPNANPFTAAALNPSAWPWNFMQPAAEGEVKAEPAAKPAKRAPRKKKSAP